MTQDEPTGFTGGVREPPKKSWGFSCPSSASSPHKLIHQLCTVLCRLADRFVQSAAMTRPDAFCSIFDTAPVHGGWRVHRRIQTVTNCGSDLLSNLIRTGLSG